MKRRWVTVVPWLVAVLVTFALAWSFHRAYKAHRIAILCAEWAEKGFPKSYAARLAEIGYEHPSWVFLPVTIDDLTWAEIIERECTPSWNLVAYTSWAPPGWEHLGVDNYLPYHAENAKAYDSGAWYQASREAIAYFMDPRNFLNESDIFMFEMLGFDAASQTPQTVENTLAGTFMANRNCDGGDKRFSDVLFEIGRRHGISPVFLAGRLSSEQGGGSVQALGKIGDCLLEFYTNRIEKVGNAVVWGKNYSLDGSNTAAVVSKGAAAYNGHYNFFNIGAYGLGIFEIKYNAWREAVSKEVCEKYCGPWTTQERAIEGGAIRIKEKYIDSCRHTRYLQKFSVLPAAGEFRWKQYMQNIGAPLTESRNTRRAYDATGALELPYRFLIPIYREMPSAPCPDPAKGKSVYSPSRS